MNQQVRHLPSTTQAAEGLPRRRWTVAEIERLSEQGVFGGMDRPRERFELIGGEIVPMNAKGAVHEIVKMELQRYWFPLVASTELSLITETTLRYAPDGFLEPDFLFWPRAIHLRDISCPAAFLLVEAADSSLAYDTGRKASIYASLGLREYWVINAPRLVTIIHREPGPHGYGTIETRGPEERLTPLLLPQLAVCLHDLGLSPLQE
jgi:Uma2 family endonuclease